MSLQQQAQRLLRRFIQLRRGQAGPEQIAAVHALKSGICHDGHRPDLQVWASTEPGQRSIELRNRFGKPGAGPLEQRAFQDDVAGHGSRMAGGRGLPGGGATGAVNEHVPALRTQLRDCVRGGEQLARAKSFHVAGHRPTARLGGECGEHVAQGEIHLVAERDAETEAERGLPRVEAQQEGAALAQQREFAAAGRRGGKLVGGDE